MVKVVKTTAIWKPIQLKSAILSGGIEGLVGIEELTDYNLLENDKPKKKIVSTPGIKLNKEKSKSIKKSRNIKIIKKLRTQKEKPNRHKTTKESKINIIKLEKSVRSDSSVSDGENKVELTGLTEESLDEIPWNILNVPKIVTKALLEQGFKEPTEIQVS